MKRILAAALLVSLGTPAFATSLESGALTKCFDIAEKPAAMKRASELGKVQTFDANSSKKLIDAINEQEPATDWQASVVDVVTTSDPDTPVHIFFSDEKKMCLIEAAKQSVWDKIADKAFGGGV